MKQYKVLHFSFTFTLQTFYVQIGFGYLHFVCETPSWQSWTPCSLLLACTWCGDTCVGGQESPRSWTVHCEFICAGIEAAEVASFKFATPCLWVPKRTKQQSMVAALFYRVSARRVGVQSQLFSGINSPASVKFWFIFFGWLDLFVVRLRVSRNRYKMHCYWTLVFTNNSLWHFYHFCLENDVSQHRNVASLKFPISRQVLFVMVTRSTYTTLM